MIITSFLLIMSFSAACQIGYPLLKPFKFYNHKLMNHDRPSTYSTSAVVLHTLPSRPEACHLPPVTVSTRCEEDISSPMSSFVFGRNFAREYVGDGNDRMRRCILDLSAKTKCVNLDSFDSLSLYTRPRCCSPVWRYIGYGSDSDV